MFLFHCLVFFLFVFLIIFSVLSLVLSLFVIVIVSFCFFFSYLLYFCLFCSSSFCPALWSCLVVLPCGHALSCLVLLCGPASCFCFFCLFLFSYVCLCSRCLFLSVSLSLFFSVSLSLFLSVFLSFFLSFFIFCEISIYFVNYILRRWGLNMINFPWINKRTALMWISYLSKTWNAILVTFLFSGKGYPKLLIITKGNHITLISRQ